MQWRHLCLQNVFLCISHISKILWCMFLCFSIFISFILVVYEFTRFTFLCDMLPLFQILIVWIQWKNIFVHHIHVGWLYIRWDSNHMDDAKYFYMRWESSHMSHQYDYSLLDILSFPMSNLTLHGLNLTLHKIIFCFSQGKKFPKIQHNQL